MKLEESIYGSLKKHITDAVRVVINYGIPEGDHRVKSEVLIKSSKDIWDYVNE